MVLALLVYAQLDALYDRVAADLRAGKPLSARVHVALCDNSMLACGNARLGDGDNLDTNLYWGTSEGFRGWFTRRGSGWRLERRERPSEGEVLERSIWTRTVPPGARWRRRGITRPIPVRVEVLAWRGRAIDHAIERYMLDLWNDPSMHVVAYIGHDRWMDRDDIAWPRAEPQNVSLQSNRAEETARQ